MRWTKDKRLTSRRVFTALMVLSALWVLALPRRWGDVADHGVAVLLRPLTHGSRAAVLAVTTAVPKEQEAVSPERVEELERDVERLRRELMNTREALAAQEALTERLAGLEQRYGLARARLIVAKVIGETTSVKRRLKVLDVGGLKQVRREQVVLAAAREDRAKIERDHLCVVGVVEDVGSFTSRWRPLQDAETRLAIYVRPGPDRREQTWRAQGFLEADGMGRLKARYIERRYPVQAGDAVMVVSDPAVLPVATLAGWVKRCEPDDEDAVLWDVEVEAAVNPETAAEVVIVDCYPE